MLEAEAVYNEVMEASQERASRLEETLFVSENFQQAMLEVMQTVRAVHDNLLSQDAPGADPATVQEQLRELQVEFLQLLVILQPLVLLLCCDAVGWATGRVSVW